MTASEINTLILDAIAHFGDATTGQIAAWIAAPTADVEKALGEMLAAGAVTILPLSLTWALGSHPAQVVAKATPEDLCRAGLHQFTRGEGNTVKCQDCSRAIPSHVYLGPDGDGRAMYGHVDDQPRVNGSNMAPAPYVYGPGERERMDAEWAAQNAAMADIVLP
jgi:hypothetical protein